MKSFVIRLFAACLLTAWATTYAVDLSYQTFVDRYTLINLYSAKHESGYMTRNGGMRVILSSTDYLFGDEYDELVPISGRPVMSELLFDSNKQLGFLPNLVRSENSYPIGFTDYVIVSTRTGPDPNPKPVFTLNPEDETDVAGTSIYLVAVAEPLGEVSLQWLKNGKPVLGATSFSLWITNCARSDSGRYSVLATIGHNSTESDRAVIKVVDPVTFRRDLLHDVTARTGKTVALTVSAKGAGRLTYEWVHNGISVQKGRSPRLTLRKVKATDAGYYYVIARDGFSTAFSSSINVSITQ